MKASILIRCLNELENLKILFPILESQTFREFEVVFIDSGSTDGSLEFVRNYKSNIPIIIEEIHKSQFSFGRSLNMAAKKSIYKDKLVSLSAHCFPTSDKWLEKILLPFARKKVEIVYGKQVGDDNSWLSEASHLNMWFGKKSEIKKSAFANNGNCAFTYKTWKLLKFNDDLTGCEDIEFAQRVMDRGGLIFYASEAEVKHYHDENSKQIRNRYRREAQALNDIYSEAIVYHLKDLIKSIFNEIKIDLKYKKNNKYSNSNLLKIIQYRYNKNLGHFLGINYPLKSTKNIKNKYYSYEGNQKNVEYFKRDYFYK